jgi:hypothetical protein
MMQAIKYLNFNLFSGLIYYTFISVLQRLLRQTLLSKTLLPTKDDINLGNIIHHKSVKSKIPPYFKDQSVPLISYVYIRPIASKMFNYKHDRQYPRRLL